MIAAQLERQEIAGHETEHGARSRLSAMKKEGASACTGCGEPTVINLGQNGPKGYERIPLCPECVELWQREPEQRDLLLAKGGQPG